MTNEEKLHNSYWVFYSNIVHLKNNFSLVTEFKNVQFNAHTPNIVQLIVMCFLRRTMKVAYNFFDYFGLTLRSQKQVARKKVQLFTNSLLRMINKNDIKIFSSNIRWNYDYSTFNNIREQILLKHYRLWISFY